tara:strand:- start:1723 stop:2022 length:300 start_codon:yes stop_codon:yes gene_type:complete
MSMVDMKTQINIKLSKDENVLKDAIVIEGFTQKYIKVVLKDQGIDHVFELKWDGYMYSGKFLDFDITCQYKVEQDFSSSKQTVTGVEKFTRKKSGYPKN